MNKMKVIILCILSILLLTGCSTNEDLSKYGIKNETDTQSNQNDDENASEKEESETTSEKEIESDSLAKDYKYPISEKVSKDLVLENEKYLTEIIELLNSDYLLGNYSNISQREKDEIENQLNTLVKEYANYISHNGRGSDIGLINLSQSNNSSNIRRFVESYYHDRLTSFINYAEELKTQKDICNFISKITMIDYYDIVNERSELRGDNIYSPEEILNTLFTNSEIIDAYIVESTYEDMKERYQNDLYNTKFFLTIKFKDGEPKFNKIEDDVNEYFSLYADWINSFVESKSTIGNEVRYYNEEKQNKLFEETKDKLEELKIEIEKICFSV